MSFKDFLRKLFIACGVALFLATIIALASDFMGLYSITAHAVDTILTPSQTLALYGTTFPVEYYDHDTDITYNLTAHYYGVSNDSDFCRFNGFVGETVVNTPFKSVSYNSGSAASTFRQANSGPALIYYIDDWAGIGAEFVSSNLTDHFNFKLDFPIDLQGLTGFRAACFWSSVVPSSHTNYSRSICTLNTSLGTFTSTSPGYNQHATSGLFWFRDPIDVDNDEDYLGYFPVLMAQHFTDGDDKMTINSIEFGCNRGRVLDSINFGISLKGKTWFFMLSCPLLSDWEPPVTTAPATTTIPRSTYDWGGGVHATTPALTVDLSTIEEQQRVQIEIENDTRNYSAGSFQGINIIISQLDAIYSEMQARGEIAVDLLPAPSLPVNSDISDYINNNLDSFTTAQLPDATLTGGIGFIGKLVSWFTESFGWLWVLAALNLSLAVLSFAIFRSKGG